MRSIILILLATVSLSVFGQGNPQIPRELELIFKYAQESDYPEVFNNQPYQFRPVSWQIIDIDNDGITEVFLQSFPHYRQSPTITIYQIDSNNTVSRIIEGLAPGPLVPLDSKDDYFDPHTTGTAMDMTLNISENEKMRVFARSSLKHGMSPILYKNFIHADKRDGKPTFLDLSYLDYKKEVSCENFQFSKPTAIIAGNIKGKTKKCFIALVGEEIYCYAIRGFTTDGWIEKDLTIIKKPADFKEFVIVDGQVKYLTRKGEKKEFKI